MAAFIPQQAMTKDGRLITVSGGYAEPREFRARVDYTYGPCASSPARAIAALLRKLERIAADVRRSESFLPHVSADNCPGGD